MNGFLLSLLRLLFFVYNMGGQREWLFTLFPLLFTSHLVDLVTPHLFKSPVATPLNNAMPLPRHTTQHNKIPYHSMYRYAVGQGTMPHQTTHTIPYHTIPHYTHHTTHYTLTTLHQTKWEYPTSRQPDIKMPHTSIAVLNWSYSFILSCASANEYPGIMLDNNIFSPLRIHPIAWKRQNKLVSTCTQYETRNRQTIFRPFSTPLYLNHSR